MWSFPKLKLSPEAAPSQDAECETVERIQVETYAGVLGNPAGLSHTGPMLVGTPALLLCKFPSCNVNEAAFKPGLFGGTVHVSPHLHRLVLDWQAHSQAYWAQIMRR